MASVEPLHLLPLAHTHDPEQFRRVLIENFGGRHFDCRHGQDFSVRCNSARLAKTGIVHCTLRAGFEAEVTDEENVWYQDFVAGNAEVMIDRRRIHLTPNNPCVTNSNQQLCVHYGSHEKILLRFNAKALADKLRALIGAWPLQELLFQPALNVEAPEAKSLRRLVAYLMEELNTTGSPSTIAVVELEQLLMTSFLVASRHNFSELLTSRPKPIAPWQVRRAEEYIEANWNTPLTIEVLAEVTNASVRSLFERFRDYRGSSPMTFVRQVRLRHAREMLLAPQANTSVTGVALSCGFMNTGHFARHYGHAFGELPSETLCRSRGTSSARP